MAKKRTLVPYYGKINQSLESLGCKLLAAGHREAANEAFQESSKILKARKFARRGGR